MIWKNNQHTCHVILRRRVWFVVAIHFVSRGLEFNEQLRINSFIVNTDDYGNMYATISHETKQKNWQSGIDKTDAQSSISNKIPYNWIFLRGAIFCDVLRLSHHRKKLNRKK